MPRRGVLYYGDNIEIVRRYLSDEPVNLVYWTRRSGVACLSLGGGP